MDIAALSSSMAMFDLGNQISTQVLAMSLDTLETTGDGVQKMMETAVSPDLGGNIDISL